MNYGEVERRKKCGGIGREGGQDMRRREGEKGDSCSWLANISTYLTLSTNLRMGTLARIS